MRSFTSLAILALPLFSSALAEPASPTKQSDAPNSIYASAHDAFQDLLNALPEESLQAALSGLKDFKHGIFESHHRGVEQVHDKNPALATKLIVAAVQDLKKRQTPSNGTTTAPPPPPPQSSNPPPAESSAPPPPPPASSNPPAQSSAPPPPPSSTDRAVIVNVPQTTTNAQGQTVVQTTSVLSQATASVPVTLVLTNSAGQRTTTTENRPAIVQTTTDAQGRTTAITSAARFAPTPGEVRTETDARGSTFVTTYTPGGGRISSIKLITTTGADGRQSVLTSYTFVDPAATPTQGGEQPTGATGRPGLQTGAAVAMKRVGGFEVAALGGVLAMFL